MNKMLIPQNSPGLCCRYPLAAGLGSYCCASWRLCRSHYPEVTYGGAFEIGAVTHHVIRVLGAFMMAVGVMTVFAVFDPQRYIAVVYTIMFLFVVRTLQRVLFAGEIEENFDISLVRLIGQSIFFLALGVAILLLRPRRSTES